MELYRHVTRKDPEKEMKMCECTVEDVVTCSNPRRGLEHSERLHDSDQSGDFEVRRGVTQFGEHNLGDR